MRRRPRVAELCCAAARRAGVPQVNCEAFEKDDPFCPTSRGIARTEYGARPGLLARSHRGRLRGEAQRLRFLSLLPRGAPTSRGRSVAHRACCAAPAGKAATLRFFVRLRPEAPATTVVPDPLLHAFSIKTLYKPVLKAPVLQAAGELGERMAEPAGGPPRGTPCTFA